MPRIALPDALRYFVAPFAICFYYFLFDRNGAKALATDFGVIGSFSFLIAGTVLYYLYRYLIYDSVVLRLYDFLRKENPRIFVKSRYQVSSTRVATQVLHKLSDEKAFADLMTKRGRPVRAAGIHLLYQTLILGWVFVGLFLAKCAVIEATLLAFSSTLLFWTAVRMDNDFEDEVLLIVKRMTPKLDQAAKALGIRKRASHGASR